MCGCGGHGHWLSISDVIIGLFSDVNSSDMKLAFLLLSRNFVASVCAPEP